MERERKEDEQFHKVLEQNPGQKVNDYRDFKTEEKI